MGGEPISLQMDWAPNQKLPYGYHVAAEWGELDDGRTGVGCYYFYTDDGRVLGVPRRTRWEARRDALAHSRGDPVEIID